MTHLFKSRPGWGLPSARYARLGQAPSGFTEGMLHYPRIVGCGRGVQNLKDEVGDTPPEDINDGPLTAPSKRIIQHVPRYETVKVRVGATAAGAIGLASLRENCPHFDAWVSNLERLSFDL